MDDRMMLTLRPSAGNDDYLNLGRTIAAQCPPGFAEARLEAELAEDGGELKILCTPGGEEEREVEVDSVAQVRIVQLLRHIRDQMASEDEAPWNRCIVTLRKGGHFRMDVGA